MTARTSCVAAAGRVALLLPLLAMLAAAPARADDTAPAEPAPSPETPFDAPFDAPAEQGQTGGGLFYNEEFDATLPEIPEAAPAAAIPAGPDYKPPRIDAYFDVAFTDSDIGSAGYSETPGGYRFIAGFRLEHFNHTRWSLAPEVGYLRIGRAMEESVTRTLNSPIQGYWNIRTEERKLDMSTLQFGVRSDYRLFGPVEAQVRAGAHFYHITDNRQITFSYEPGPLDPPPLPDDVQPNQSASDVGLDLFATIGLAVRLGTVPSLYIEYGSYNTDRGTVGVSALGFLLNF
ncbi:MAG: hypothetical protein ACOY3X_07155 [Pseudomonadota bacterium]